jgi:hypothetical protein
MFKQEGTVMHELLQVVNNSIYMMKLCGLSEKAGFETIKSCLHHRLSFKISDVVDE